MNKLYVANIPFKAAEDDLRDLFADSGEVREVAIITERETGRSRGFGFVTMGSDDEAQRAIDNLNDQSFMGRELTVAFARERTVSSRRDERR